MGAQENLRSAGRSESGSALAHPRERSQPHTRPHPWVLGTGHGSVGLVSEAGHSLGSGQFSRSSFKSSRVSASIRTGAQSSGFGPDGWMTLAAVAASTHRLRLGTTVSCVYYRHCCSGQNRS